MFGRFGKKVKYGDVTNAVQRALRRHQLPDLNVPRATQAWRKMLQRLYPLGSISENNRVTLFRDGDQAFTSMWASIDSAQSSVWLETFTLEPDNVGLRTIKHLEGAAERGVDVRLIYDSLGSWQIDDHHMAGLIEAGAKVIPFRPLRAELRPWKWRLLSSEYMHRDHRKLLLVDDRVAFTGGMNMTRDYAGARLGGSGYFSDCQIRVEGPAVEHLAEVFADSERDAQESGWEGFRIGPYDWRRRFNSIMYGASAFVMNHNPFTHAKSLASGSNKKKKKNASPLARSNSSLLQILLSNVRREKWHIQRVLPMIIEHSSTYCFITSPYFLPPRRLNKALIRAARRGVDVRIITAGRTDVALARHAGRYVYDAFLKAGIKIYEMKTSALHAKTLVVDDVYSIVGSFNMDTMSESRNLEVCVAVLDPSFALKMKQRLRKFIRESRNITLDELQSWPWHYRALQWICYHISRIPVARREKQLE